MPSLIITADDYGYAPGYDEGIAEAARAGAIDAVSAMVTRYPPDPASLAESGVAIGLHLDLEHGPLDDQLSAFERLFGRPPTHLDGHHHCHRTGPAAIAVANLARELNLPVRSVDARHRRLLRCKGVATPDRLVGRSAEAEPALPDEVAEMLQGAGPNVITEWMTHPGHPDRSAGSTYDAGREEDLRLLLELSGNPLLRTVRTTHAAPR
jgi:predicted glycoside hydrolase/deacetylase ChbG (UPF0249 family)